MMEMVQHDMRRFVGFRPDSDLDSDATPNLANPPAEIQFEGVIMSDGKVFIQWRTNVNSTSLFDSMDHFMMIHGHPEFGSQIFYLDELNRTRFPELFTYDGEEIVNPYWDSVSYLIGSMDPIPYVVDEEVESDNEPVTISEVIESIVTEIFGGSESDNPTDRLIRRFFVATPGGCNNDECENCS